MKADLMIGTWAWGNHRWNYGTDFDKKDITDVFIEANNLGIHFFDTAIGYKNGKRILGESIKKTGLQNVVKVSSKIMPYPWRFNKIIIEYIVKRHIRDLGINKLFLLQIHRPLPPFKIEDWIEILIFLKEKNLIDNIGISNCNTDEMLKAHSKLKSHGFKLYSNQIPYNLVYRYYEFEDLFEVAKDNDIKIYAYSPLASGILSGQYTSDFFPRDKIRRNLKMEILDQLSPLYEYMQNIMEHHHLTTISEVALRWIIQRGAVPIVGAKKMSHLNSYRSISNWSLDKDEMEGLDYLSKIWLNQ
jgi:aryl-alcohol dehydrogenase-like predicted oxidoreductase